MSSLLSQHVPQEFESLQCTVACCSSAKAAAAYSTVMYVCTADSLLTDLYWQWRHAQAQSVEQPQCSVDVVIELLR
eukprot:15490-Heterococcus_DN1.PRE.2